MNDPRRMRKTGHVARMGEMRNIYKILFRISEGNIRLGRPKCSGKDSIWFDLKKPMRIATGLS
jgi:hypothetical protein